MKRSIFAVMALIISLNSATAEGFTVGNLSANEVLTNRSSAQGMLFNRDVMSVADMGSFSQSSFQYGTARSMAMAGAMTSLGGDASSMMINPAGLGMYRSGEVTLTPMVTIQNSDTKGGDSYLNDGANTFAMSNFSTVFNLYESGNSRLISVNMGLGYNKISDLNYEYSFRSMGNSSSIANLFSRQFTSEGVELDEVYGEDYPNWNSMPTNLWGAALGYKTGLTFQTYGPTPSGYNSSDEITSTTSGNPIWTSSWISSDATVDQYMAVESDGSIGEYDIAMGMNIDNTLYIGCTFGVQTLYQRLDLMYGEEYSNNNTGGSALEYSKYNQTIITDGVGVNLKIGATYRPMEALRIGIAYHSPTWYSLNREYQASMGSSSITNGERDYIVVDSPLLSDYGDNKWKFNTPSRILIGGSYTFDSRALVSIDYQRDWYGGIKTRSLPMGVSQDLYDGISDIYQSVNTLRMGAEFKIAPTFALRGGYGFSSSMVRDDVSMTSLLGSSTTNSIKYYSMGVGYAPTQGVSLDLTYMRQSTEYSYYTLFYGMGDIEVDSEYDSQIPSAASAQSGSFLTTLKQNNIVFSLTLKM